jgi:hypothetical protein
LFPKRSLNDFYQLSARLFSINKAGERRSIATKNRAAWRLGRLFTAKKLPLVHEQQGAFSLAGEKIK